MAGFTLARYLLWGAKTPWKRVKWTLGLGTRATSLAMKSSGPEKGHFGLIHAIWLDEKSGTNIEIELTGVDSIMVDVSAVKLAEFMKDTWAESG